MVSRKSGKKKDAGCHHAYHKLFMGLLIFLFGLILYLGYDWSVAFMGLGAIWFLKGLWMYSKMR